MPEVTLDLIFALQQRTLEELRVVRADIGDLKADMEVQTAIIRRLDTSVQNLTGEVRALAGQQDRQRQKLERLAARLDRLDAPEPV
jgi:predicted RNase H-like nuclease (RuvC/YqgF family)